MKKQIGKIRPARTQEVDDQRHQVPRANRNPRKEMILMIFERNRNSIDDLEHRYDLSEQMMLDLFDAILAILYEPVDAAARVPDIVFGDYVFGKEYQDESTLSL